MPEPTPSGESPPGSTPPESVAATFCATLVDEWARAGITDAIVCPGSRSTPLALALASDGRIRVDVHPDERSAGFIALGLGLATGRPAVVLTTSGTAAVELHPAVVEAHHARVPLIACTADRPPELHHVGAPQTIDQVHLFGSALRWFADPGPPDGASAGSWRSTGSRAVAEATGHPPGPVHLNLAFREPLVGSAGALPPGRDGGLGWHDTVDAARGAAHPATARTAAWCRGRAGVIVAGAGASIEDPDAVLVLARVLGWPVLADPRSGCRVPGEVVVAHADPILRSALADRLTPQVVLRLGEPPASTVLARWVAASGAFQVLVETHGKWFDPERLADLVVRAEPSQFCLELAAALDGHGVDAGWLRAWSSADRSADAAIDQVIGRHSEPTEPGVARAVVTAAPEGSSIVVSSSMPVRDLEWFAPARTGLRVLANRGANGIDGVVSTSIGVALAGGPTLALVGDLAMLHDTNGLIGAARRGIDLVIVVVDNDGGGIFSFLAQAAALAPERFEQLFGTPHGVDLVTLAAAHGLPATVVDSATDVAPAIDRAFRARGVSMVVVSTDRTANVAVHDELNATVAAAIGATGATGA